MEPIDEGSNLKQMSTRGNSGQQPVGDGEHLKQSDEEHEMKGEEIDMTHQAQEKNNQTEDGVENEEYDNLDLADSDNHEMEVIFRYEADLPGRYLNCKKNPRHISFIPVNEFNLSHLPSDYQQSALVDLVQEQAKLAVCLKVNGSSPHRPLIAPGTTNVPYPFSGIRFRNALRYGSGWIQQILQNKEKDMTVCPCSQCQQSGELRFVWTKVKVATAAHVVYDITEAKKCTCQLFYDTESIDLTSCPSLTEAIEVDIEPRTDYCFIWYAIHDEELSAILDRNLKRYKTVCKAVTDSFKPHSQGDTHDDIASNISQLYNRCKHMSALYGKQREKIKTIFEGNLLQQWRLFKTGQGNAVANLDGIGVCVLAKLTGNSQLAEQTLNNISGMYEQSCLLVEHVRKLKDNYEALQKDKNERDKLLFSYYSFLDHVLLMERDIHQYKTKFGTDTNVDVDEFPAVEPVYDLSHPLVIIVSHPHGCSKKVTIGQVTEKIDRGGTVVSSYKYNNPTCPGSSGSRVFVLGRAGAFNEHAHSGSQCSTTGSAAQTNESVQQGDM